MTNRSSRLEDLALALPSTWRVCAYESVTSTMDAARQHVDQIVEDRPFVSIARRQLAGRGRQGRVWVSSIEGFYATYGFRVDDVARLPGWSLAVGVVVRRVLAGFGVSALLKWPNDLLSAEGHKLAGILIEVLARERGSVVLTGIGVNLSGGPLPENAASVVSLGGQPCSAVEFGAALSEPLWQAWQEFKRQGFSFFREEWECTACWLGEPIEVQQSSEVVRGSLHGVGLNGELLVRTEQGIREVLTGDVVKVRRQRVV